MKKIIAVLFSIAAILVFLLIISIYFLFRDPAIIRAARSGNIENVSQLLSSGTDINETNMALKTPLMAAVKSNNINMVKYLLANGANPNKNSFERGTALYMATTRKNKEMVKLLLNHGAEDGAESLKWSIDKNDLIFVKFLVEEAQINVDARVKWGSNYTPLMFAVQEENIEIAEYLISQGADVNAVNDSGTCVHGYTVKTPLDILYHPERHNTKNYEDMVKILKRNGAHRGNEPSNKENIYNHTAPPGPEPPGGPVR